MAARIRTMPGTEARLHRANSGHVEIAKQVARASYTTFCLGRPAIDPRPIHLDLKKDRGLAVQWADGTSNYYSIAYLRKMSPSADAKELRAEMARNPLTVLPSSVANRGGGGPITAVDAEFVGNYAIRIRFSDGHDTGIYSWRYLKEIAPVPPQEPSSERES